MAKIENLKELAVNDLNNRPETAMEIDDSNWKPAFSTQSRNWREYSDSLMVVRGTFVLPELNNDTRVNLFTKSIVENQSIYINGHLIAANVKRDDPNQSYKLDNDLIKPGKNTYSVTGKRFRKRHQWDEPNTDPGLVQVVYPSEKWKRKVFNGLSQVILQADKQAGEIVLTASSPGLEKGVVKIQAKKAPVRAAVR